MTLDEAIERYISNAEYERTHGNLQGCLDFKQLVEWLKDYKRLKEQESCEDAISRQAVNRLQKYRYNCGVASITCVSLNSINTLPPVTPKPKMGRWIILKDEYGDVVEAVCSCCDENGNHKWAFCPHCGAKMVEPQAESEE